MNQQITWIGDTITFDPATRVFGCNRESTRKMLNAFVLPDLFFHPGIADQEWYALTEAATFLQVEPPPVPPSMMIPDNGTIY